MRGGVGEEEEIAVVTQKKRGSKNSLMEGRTQQPPREGTRRNWLPAGEGFKKVSKSELN